MSLDLDADKVKLGAEEWELSRAIPKMAGFFSYYDTGLLPTQGTGVILHRQGLDSEQIVYQIEPERRATTYKQRESSEHKDVYNLLYPYTILLIAYEGGVFKGVRHFYSPTPIYTLDQPLFLVNLPNTNIRGYQETSIGWVCLYLKDSGNGIKEFSDRLTYALARWNPLGEPYNYGNMSRTDGFGFYKEFKPKEPHLWDPAKWQEATQEGQDFSWVIDPETWIQARTKDPMLGSHSTALKDDKYNLTLRRCLYDDHYVYYSERGAVLMNQFCKLDEKQKKDFLSQNLRRSIVGGGLRGGTYSAPAPPPPNPEDILNDFKVTEKERKVILQLLLDVVCNSCGGVYDRVQELPQKGWLVKVKPAPQYTKGAFFTADSFLASAAELHFGYLCRGCRSSTYELPSDSTLKTGKMSYKSTDGRRRHWSHVTGFSRDAVPSGMSYITQRYVEKGSWKTRRGFASPKLIKDSTCGCGTHWDPALPVELWATWSPKTIRQSDFDHHKPNPLERMGCLQCTPAGMDPLTHLFVAFVDTAASGEFTGRMRYSFLMTDAKEYIDSTGALEFFDLNTSYYKYFLTSGYGMMMPFALTQKRFSNYLVAKGVRREAADTLWHSLAGSSFEHSNLYVEMKRIIESAKKTKAAPKLELDKKATTES